MKLNKWLMIHTVCIFLLNFPLHFLFDIFPNFLTSLISPVNESIFEHMKMVFSSFIIWATLYSFIFKRKDMMSYLFSFTISSILCIGIFLTIYIPFIIIYKEIMIITFLFLLLSILLSQIACYYILFFSKIKYQSVITFSILILFYGLFYYFTYYPPKLEFFKDPINQTYGLTS